MDPSMMRLVEKYLNQPAMMIARLESLLKIQKDELEMEKDRWDEQLVNLGPAPGQRTPIFMKRDRAAKGFTNGNMGFGSASLTKYLSASLSRLPLSHGTSTKGADPLSSHQRRHIFFRNDPFYEPFRQYMLRKKKKPYVELDKQFKKSHRNNDIVEDLEDHFEKSRSFRRDAKKKGTRKFLKASVKRHYKYEVRDKVASILK